MARRCAPRHAPTARGAGGGASGNAEARSAPRVKSTDGAPAGQNGQRPPIHGSALAAALLDRDVRAGPAVFATELERIVAEVLTVAGPAVVGVLLVRAVEVLEAEVGLLRGRGGDCA